MIFDQLTNALYADDGVFLKTVHCPRSIRAEQLARFSSDTPDRFCNYCKKTVRCIDDLTDKDVQSDLAKDESLCVFATPKAQNIVFLQPIGSKPEKRSGLPVVQTMRSLEAMADAQASGFNLVFKSTGNESAFGERKYLLYQHKSTGRLWWSGDYRDSIPPSENLNVSDTSDWVLVRDWFFVRPDRPFPIAAYAVPKDIKLGTRVYLEDLIEDVLQLIWNQGDSVRLVSTEATWNGVDFEFDEPMSAVFSG
jgi:hypothetical protein